MMSGLFDEEAIAGQRVFPSCVFHPRPQRIASRESRMARRTRTRS